MQSAKPGVRGVVVVDTNGSIVFATGLGADSRVRALSTEPSWLDEVRHKRIQALKLDRLDLVVLLAPLQGGDLLLISESPGDAVVDFVGSVDFAYDVIDHLLSDPFEALTVVGRDKRIAFLSPVHEKFFGLGRGEAIGRPVRDVIENTRIDRVVDTGRREIGEIQQMRGVERVVSRIPIKHDGEVIGAIGRVMFKGPEQLDRMARRIVALESEVEFYRREVSVLRNRSYGLDNLIGDSVAMRKLRADIIKVAPLDIPVLITGESGTGKELVAHSLHQLSHRRDASMVVVNAGALPAMLVESELFGYEPGAFTGAHKKGHRGKFEQAAGGTIFLDEIGDMPLEVQVKLLRVLQDRTIDRVGGDRPQEVDFRLVAATNCDLRRSVADSKFRLDLYYRISAIVIEVPPLRSRAGDIPKLAQRFLREIAERHARPLPDLTEDALSYMLEQPWPGNVRQLRHEVERAFVFAENGRITADALRQRGDAWDAAAVAEVPRPTEPAGLKPVRMQDAVSQVEADVIRQALSRHKGNKKRVATELGISRSYLYKVLDLHGI